MSSPSTSPQTLQNTSTLVHLISAEQYAVVAAVAAGKNAVVDAVAGSGKSTTVLSLARAMPEKRFLQMTYNAMLRKEFREKVAAAALDNVDVHTYHSLATKHYAPGAYTDAALRGILRDKTPPLVPLPAYDVLVLDEVQDCTPLYHRFVLHVVGALPHKIQLVLLGDRAQRIYEFKGADERFLTHGPELWAGAPFLWSNEFERCTLRTSYRLSNQMAAFVNGAMLGEKRIDACRDAQKVVYMRGRAHQMGTSVVARMRALIAGGSSPGDFFLVSGSVRGALASKMENALVDAGIPCHIATGESRDVDERVIAGKAAFVTCHGCKGRQRKYVFVLGFDNSYFSYYGRELPRDMCPNTLYVAATRATEGLFLLEHFDRPTDRFLEFLRMSHRDMQKADFVDFQGAVQTGIEREAPEDPEKARLCYTSPTKLIQFVSDATMEALGPALEKLFVREADAGKPLELPGFISTKLGLHEDVSDINGVAMPAIYETHLRAQSGCETPSLRAPAGGLYGLIKEKIEDLRDHQHAFLKREFASLPPVLAGPSDYLRAANLYLAIQDQLYFRVKQIARDEYVWLTEEAVCECLARFDTAVGPDLGEVGGEAPEFEVAFVQPGQEFEHEHIDVALAVAWPDAPAKFRFSARADLVTEMSLWELKCTSALSAEHFLQTIIYAWLWRLVPHVREADRFKDTRLFNVMTGEAWRLEASDAELTAVMVMLLRDKYASLPVEDDAAFVAAGRAHLIEPNICGIE